MDEVRIERRSLLWLPVALAGGVLLRGTPLLAADLQAAAGEAGALTPLTRNEFGKRWLALAKELLPLSKEFDESYAAQLCGLIARVPIAELPKLENGRSEKGLTGGPSWRLLPCLTIEFRMEPGAILKHHNHPPLVVATLCAAGEVSYRHFEINGDAPPCTKIDGRTFEVRETRSGVLVPGRTTVLTRARDGIHGFVAGDDGARIIDFSLGLTADSETFSYVEISAEPIEPERRRYEARWIGKNA